MSGNTDYNVSLDMAREMDIDDITEYVLQVKISGRTEDIPQCINVVLRYLENLGETRLPLEDHVNMSGAYELLRDLLSILLQDRDELQEDYDELQKDHENLRENHEDLLSILIQDRDELQEDYDELQKDHENLRENHEATKGQIKSQDNETTLLLLAQIGNKLDKELVKKFIQGSSLEGNEATLQYHLNNIMDDAGVQKISKDFMNIDLRLKKCNVAFVRKQLTSEERQCIQEWRITRNNTAHPSSKIEDVQKLIESTVMAHEDKELAKKCIDILLELKVDDLSTQPN